MRSTERGVVLAVISFSVGVGSTFPLRKIDATAAPLPSRRFHLVCRQTTFNNNLAKVARSATRCIVE